MWNKLWVYTGMLYLLEGFSYAQGQYHVIRKSGTEDYITLGSVFRTVTVNSASECASLCASTSGCQSSMLMGQSCSLYTQSCTCPGEKISHQLSSHYKLFNQSLEASGTAVETCAQHGMHLVAINSEIEQLAIKALVQSQCKYHHNSILHLKCL